MRKPTEKKYLASIADGGLDADSAAFAVGLNKVVNAENVRWGTTDQYGNQAVQAIGGTLQISEAIPSQTFYTIGSAEDVDNARIVWFKYCTTGPWHKIMCYDSNAGREYTVLMSSQVTGGLNFSGSNLIHSARIINGLLYWTDDNNEQRKINIDSGIKLNHPDYVTSANAYQLPIAQETITLLRKPPAYPLQVEKAVQPSVNSNFLGKNGFWFSYRYIYYDGETSVPSMHSQLIGYNTKTEAYNKVIVEVPFSELINQDVRRVEIGVRVDNDTQFFGVKVWDKEIATQATEIANHNSGTAQLTYNFYNNTVGEGWGDSYSVKPFDRVPIRSRTLEIARNRLNLGNNTLGYDAPTTTSLTLSLDDQTEGAAVVGIWYEVVVDNGFGNETYYVLSIQGIGTSSGYYSLLPYPGATLPLPITADFTDYELAGVTGATVAGYFGVRPSDLVSFTALSDTATVSNAPSNVTLIGSTAYKTQAQYKLGVVFYDYGDRKSTIVTSDDKVLETADRDYDTLAYTVGINWEVSNTNALNEIPTWAKTYAIVRTKCLRTRYFLQSRAANMTYVSLDADGLYEFTNSLYSNTRRGVGIDISSLQSFNAGYTYAEGDIVKVYISGDNSVYFLSIIGQSGKWIVAQLQDVGTLGTESSAFTTGFFEIYTPYQQSANEPMYEVGQRYTINNAGTVDRAYSILNGTIRGDITVLQRNIGGSNYLTENMSPNDLYYQNWFTDAGRLNLVSLLGQSVQPNSIVTSNTFIFGSNVNGLSSFDALDETFIPYECGDIQKLQVTSKVNNEQGSVMLCICTRQWVSLYIGEVQVVGSASNAFLAQASTYIGTINVLKGNYGTVNPESVTEYRGMVFCFDANSGRIIQYASNGLFPISNYQMTRFWKQFSKQYLSMTAAQIEALGSRPYVFTSVDPFHGELLISIPKLLSAPPKGYLPDLGLEEVAVGSITITDVGDAGDSIQVFVNDPTYGNVSLGTYVRQSSDTNTVILAASIVSALGGNSYGYEFSSERNVISITARAGLGSSINGGGRLTVSIVSPDKILINGSDILLINSSDKFLV